MTTKKYYAMCYSDLRAAYRQWNDPDGAISQNYPALPMLDLLTGYQRCPIARAAMKSLDDSKKPEYGDLGWRHTERLYRKLDAIYDAS